MGDHANMRCLLSWFYVGADGSHVSKIGAKQRIQFRRQSGQCGALSYFGSQHACQIIVINGSTEAHLFPGLNMDCVFVEL